MTRNEFRQRAMIHVAAALVKVMAEKSGGMLDNMEGRIRLAANAAKICDELEPFTPFDIEPGEPTYNPAILDCKLWGLDLSTRTLNALMENHINTMRELLQMNRREFSKLKNVGKKTVIEIEDFLVENHLYWGMKE